LNKRNTIYFTLRESSFPKDPKVEVITPELRNAGGV
jgi:hypothetical protein